MSTPTIPEVDPHDTPEYQAFVEECAKECHCSDGPCDSCLSGGPCDGWFKDPYDRYRFYEEGDE